MTDFERCGDIVEYYLLSFVVSCSLQNRWHEIDKLVEHISLEPEAIIRTELISILKGNDINTTDALANNFKLIMSFRHQKNTVPIHLIIGAFHHTLITIQIGIDIKQPNLISRLAFESFKVKWLYFWGQQRCLLKDPEYHFANINRALSVKDYSWTVNVLCLMKAILPTLNVGDELKVNRTLDKLLLQVRTSK